jgi:hypothetical protein
MWCICFLHSHPCLQVIVLRAQHVSKAYFEVKPHRQLEHAKHSQYYSSVIAYFVLYFIGSSLTVLVCSLPILPLSLALLVTA